MYIPQVRVRLRRVVLLLLVFSFLEMADTSQAATPPATAYPGWARVFTEEFNTPSVDFPGQAYSTQWDAYPATWPDTSGFGSYGCASTCSVADGSLTLHLHGEHVAAPTPNLPVLS